MSVTKRVIQIQTSKIDARLAAAKRQGSHEAFKLQLASIGEALAANASPEVALQYMSQAQRDRADYAAQRLATCAILDTAVYKPLNKVRK
jgi:hypothetical protein